MSVGPTPPPKWVRATRLIDQLDGEIRGYLDRAAVPDSTTEGQVVLRILESPPESLSLLLGDALQNLHSALDHEVHRQSVARMAAPSHRPSPGGRRSQAARADRRGRTVAGASPTALVRQARRYLIASVTCSVDELGDEKRCRD